MQGDLGKKEAMANFDPKVIGLFYDLGSRLR